MTLESLARDLGLAAALLDMDRVASEDLHQIATAALSAGTDSPSLRQLAGLTSYEPNKARDLFRDVMEELHINAPSPLEVHWMLARHHAHRVVERALAPERGASLIVGEFAYQREYPEEVFDLIQLIDMWEENPQEREAIRGKMTSAIQEFLSAAELRD